MSGPVPSNFVPGVPSLSPRGSAWLFFRISGNVDMYRKVENGACRSTVTSIGPVFRTDLIELIPNWRMTEPNDGGRLRAHDQTVLRCHRAPVRELHALPQLEDPA